MKNKQSQQNTKDRKREPRVAIVMGSDSDSPTMRAAAETLTEFGIAYEAKVLSAHRTPRETIAYVEDATRRGVQVFIAGAGLAAHLPGVVAAFTTVPVIGVPLASGPLQGQDSLLSIVQMPKGVPVATVAIGNAANAGILAAQILASGGAKADRDLEERLRDHRTKLAQSLLAKNVPF
ncbi:MAG: 5-(carboxyamino)imidazole ribonucleotide mutase [Bdellovibrionota bacterium]